MAYKFYTETHEWAEMDEDGLITVGLTAQLLGPLGNITAVTLPEPGRSLARGETCGRVEGDAGMADLSAPLSGTITDPNPALIAEPAMLNQTPATTAWCFKIRLADPATLAELMPQAAYDRFVTTSAVNL